MIYRLFLTALLFCALTVSADAQVVEKYSENNSIVSRTLSDYVLPSDIDEMSFDDGRLHLSAGGMLFTSVDNGGVLGFPEEDTISLDIDSRMTYSVRHSATERLYLTKRDLKGNMYLYERYEKKPGKYDVRRVKPSGFSFTIEHPVFSSDGRVMVFASNCPLGFGGLDLWYSEWKNDEWQYPQNMGHRINTEGNEVSPFIYGDFLLFSSNGRVGGYGGYDIYSSRLVALEQTGDTVVMFPIGRCPVYSLQAPFCSRGDDYGMTVNDDGTVGWWLESESDGRRSLHSFSGRLDCVKLTGTVVGHNGQPIVNASVVARTHDGRSIETSVDKDGEYVLYLQPNEEYEMTYMAPEHFQHHQRYMATRQNENSLYYRDNMDVDLKAYVIGQNYRYGDLFGSSVGSELTSAGRTRMDAVALFLMDNPGLKVVVVSSFNQSADRPFCNLVNQSRLRAISDYLSSKGVPLTSIVTETGTNDNDESGEEDGMMMSAVAVSSRTVSFVFER